MENQSVVPPAVAANIRKLLADSPGGYEVNNLATPYFNKFGNFAYPDKLGFRGWAEMLGQPDIQEFCVFYDKNSVKHVKLRDLPKAAVVPPVQKPTTRQNANGSTASAGGSSQNNQNLVAVKRPPASPDTATSPHKAKLIQRQAEQASEISGGQSLGKRSGSETSRSSSKRLKDSMDSQSNSETDFSELSHISISAHNKQKLSRERSKINWIQKHHSPPLNFNNLILERQVQNAEEAHYIDCTFCDRPILENLMEVKNYTRRVNSDRFVDVRNRHNNFEFQKGAIFQHGAAIKVANIDALMGMQLTNPKGPDGSSLVQSNELLYFADVYGGPGGVAEYFLWKKKWQAKGFGITPRGETDYNLLQAEHFPRESFETFYGESATEGTGDIGRPIFLSKFVTFVKESTDQKGVHVMFASGGETSRATDEDQKELRCKHLFLAEFLIALQVVREGGHFVCRLYDLYIPFTVGLVYLMYRAFDQVAIFKPDSSLPASSEKYMICKWRKPQHQIAEISNYLSECHKIDWLTKRSRKRATEGFAEIIHLLSIDTIKESYRFFEYIRRTNSELGNRQFVETTRLATSIREGNEERYIHERLKEIQDKCLTLWGIPDRVREKPKYSKAKTPGIRAVKLLTPYSFDFISQTDREGEVELSMAVLLNDLTNPREWSFMAVGRERGFYMCLGGNQIFRYMEGTWDAISEPLELMNNTLVYADMVDEFQIKGAKQTMWTSFHIIDALVLGGKDVRDLPSNERSDMISKFARSMNKASRDDLCSIRPKLTYELKDVKKFFNSVKEFNVRNREGKLAPRYLCPAEISDTNNVKFIVDGVLFVKKYKANFVPADFRFCVQNRLYWKWNVNVNVIIPQNFVPGPLEHHMEQDEQDEDNVVPVHATTLLQHLHECK